MKNLKLVDIEALQIEIAASKDAGDRSRVADLEHALWMGLHHRIAGPADPGQDIIDELRRQQMKKRRRGAA